jgi:amino acid transporter
MAPLGLEVATLLSYTGGDRTKWMATSRVVVLALSVGLISVLGVIGALGLRFGKWLHNAGAILRISLYGILLLLPVANAIAGAPGTLYPLHLEMPKVSVFSLNILGKMGFGAFSGFEYVAIFAFESRTQERSFTRSVVIATPIVLAMFILGTSSVLAFTPPESIDLIAPMGQAFETGTRSLGAAHAIVPLVLVGNLAALLGWAAAAFGGIARLPMVAGWDGLMPSIFTKLHPRWRTPVGSVLLVAVAALVLAVAGGAGVGEQEAYQLFSSAALVFYALTYLVMFAIPIVATRRLPRTPPVWLRALSASGFAMTLLFIVLAVVPIVEVKSTTMFSVKVVSVIVAANALGAALYAYARQRWKT